MGQYPDPAPLTPAQEAARNDKIKRLAGVLSVFWNHHGRPATEAEAITQANALYAQLYPDIPSADCPDCLALYPRGQA